jgi:hypothetical protein
MWKSLRISEVVESFPAASRMANPASGLIQAGPVILQSDRLDGQHGVALAGRRDLKPMQFVLSCKTVCQLIVLQDQRHQHIKSKF